MQNKQYLANYVQQLIQKINNYEEQWKDTRFAAIDQSIIDPEQDDDNQYEQMLEKYRGKNGNIKPLGLILFNKYICSLFVLFLALTLLFVPVAMIYSFGGGLAELKTTSSFSKNILIFSIANLPRYRLDDLTEAQLSQISFHRYLTLTTDVIAILVIFVYVLYLKVVLTQITNQYMAKSPAPNLYCLEIHNIQGCKQEQVLEHFSKLGKVAQISSIFTHKEMIYELRKIVKLVTHLCHLKPDMEQYQKTVQKIEKKYKQLAGYYLKIPKPQLKSTFICFQQISTRNRVYDLYKYEINPEKLDFCIQPQFRNQVQIESLKTGTNQKSEAEMLNKQSSSSSSSSHKIRPVVRKCKYEPLTINWQNCDIDKSSQNVKFCCQFFLLVIVAFVILLGLFLLNINSSHIRESKANQNSEISILEQNLSNDKQSRERYTFCASLSLVDFKWEYYDLCAEYIEFEKNKFALMLTFSLMVAVINLLTNRILWALVTFRRYRTLAERNSFLVTSIFCFSLLNSAILILLVRGHYTGPILRKIVGYILNFSENQMLVTVYSQFSRNWYMNIGAQLIMNYTVSLIIFPHFHIILHWVRSKYRQIKARHTQKQVKKPVFNYCTFYAMSLKSIFFALMYANSMPVFYFLCLIALGVQMVLGKFLLKQFVEEPVFVDNNTIEVATKLIPYSLLLHCFTSILFLNVEQIFPTENSYENIHNNWTETNLLKLQRGFVYVLVFLFISIYIFNRKRIDQIILGYCLGRTSSSIQSDQNKKFKDIKNNPAFLASYKMKDNPKYRILYYALHLFCSHMQKIQDKKQSINIEDEFLDISAIFEEQTRQEVHQNMKNMSSLKNVQDSDRDEPEQITQNRSLKQSEILVDSVVWTEENIEEDANQSDLTKQEHKKLIKQIN